jgi:hypothetical protein
MSQTKSQRVFQLNIRITPEEREAMRRVAERRKRSVADWARLRLLSDPAYAAELRKAVGG